MENKRVINYIDILLEQNKLADALHFTRILENSLTKQTNELIDRLNDIEYIIIKYSENKIGNYILFNDIFFKILDTDDDTLLFEINNQKIKIKYKYEN